jgi:hypothetical protein
VVARLVRVTFVAVPIIGRAKMLAPILQTYDYTCLVTRAFSTKKERAFGWRNALSVVAAKKTLSNQSKGFFAQ